MDKLLQDALQAYNELGGEAYLEKHPELLERILLYKMQKQATSQELEVVIEVPWLSTERLAYRTKQRSLVQDTQDAVLIEAKPANSPPAVGWRDGDPDIGARAFRAEQDLKKP